MNVLRIRRHSLAVKSPSRVFLSTSDNCGKTIFLTKLSNSSSEPENCEVLRSRQKFSTCFNISPSLMTVLFSEIFSSTVFFA